MRLSRLEKHIVAAAAVAAGVAASANAAVVTWNCNLTIPANLDGLYIKIDTQQVISTAGTGLTGWDINPYGSGSIRRQLAELLLATGYWPSDIEFDVEDLATVLLIAKKQRDKRGR